MSESDYFGGFSKDFLSNYAKKYLEQEVVFGYLGHEVRTIEFDEIIENTINSVTVLLDGKPVDKKEILGVWITSSNARHWCNYVSDKIDEGEDFKDHLLNSLKDIFVTGYVYSLPEPDGKWVTTNRLYKEYDKRFNVFFDYY